ncbi:MAG: AAA family ATPase, partial [Ruminococcus sp.]|nr:AAA family ATPase [Ruminococcus sp.]
MGIYLNPQGTDFEEALNSEIYIDKSELIKYTNKVLRTKQKYICVSRPRRFGKSMAAEMLTAYYSCGCDSKEMFSRLKIAEAESFEKHLNRYNVIHINMVNFLGESQNMDEMIGFIEEDLIEELKNEYPNVRYPRRENLIKVIAAIFSQTNIPFIFIIDEWDCIFRVHKSDEKSQTKYLNFLRNLLKDQSYVALAYMTGILPIKKYGEH